MNGMIYSKCMFLLINGLDVVEFKGKRERK